MRAFACPTCSSLLFFGNDRCVTCGTVVGFDPATAALIDVDRSRLVRCENVDLADCNWVTDSELCRSCRLTRTRPADSDTAALAAFAGAEAAKRRLMYQLDHLGLPTSTGSTSLSFDLLSSSGSPVTTGHADGVVTIDLAEGDDAHREAMRVQLAEPYRTMLGHLRPEVGHWYWQVLVDGTPFLDRFRDLFGDERADYAQALDRHYSCNPSDDWRDTHVSHYAAAHPWEDWAETFAHYLHIRDTTETAQAWGLHVDGPDLELAVAWDATLDVDPVEDVDSFDELARSWLALQFVLNALNRSMGSDDLYPFRLTPAVLEKLRFVHVLVTSYR